MKKMTLHNKILILSTRGGSEMPTEEHWHMQGADSEGGRLPNKYDGMIVEIVEKHP